MLKKKRKPAPVRTHQSVSDAFGTILQEDFRVLEKWESAARNWQDTEGVHQMRVSFRRMRSAMSTFRPAVPSTLLQPWTDTLRELANRLGPARDMDVFIEEGLGPLSGVLQLPGEQAFLERAKQRRAAAYKPVRDMLDGDRYATFKQAFGQWLRVQGWQSTELREKQRRRLEGNIVPFARRMLDHRAQRVLEAGINADRDSAPDMHRLRIQCKKLRYGTEFFTPLFTDMDDFVTHLKALQDLLGIMNDVAVMHQLVDDLLDDSGDPDLRAFAGSLIGWRTRQVFEVRDSFSIRWSEFMAAGRPWWAHS